MFLLIPVLHWLDLSRSKVVPLTMNLHVYMSDQPKICKYLFFPVEGTIEFEKYLTILTWVVQSSSHLLNIRPPNLASLDLGWHKPCTDNLILCLNIAQSPWTEVSEDTSWTPYNRMSFKVPVFNFFFKIWSLSQSAQSAPCQPSQPC